MLKQMIADPIALGLVQAVVVSVLALAVVFLAQQRGIHLERDAIVALIRGLVQVVSVGSVLVLLLSAPTWSGVLVLLAMVGAATAISSRRAQGIPGVRWLSFVAIGLGAGVVIVIMTALGIIDYTLTSLVPVGSMVIANSMNTSTLALERFKAEVEAHTGFIEAGLALGAAPHIVLKPYVQATVEASLIPRIDSLRSLGIVWIPGIMTGMILAGTDPIVAALFQFVIIAMIFASSGLTAIIALLLVRSQVFTPAEQLLLKPFSSN